MSDGKRMTLEYARALALGVVDLLRPLCDRIEVAGSVRRQKAEVGDVEIVCIPKAQFDLVGQAYRTDKDIEHALYQAGLQFRKNGPKFKQFDVGDGRCDLFLTTPEQWGVIFTLRTGSAEFSHRLVMPKALGGMLPGYLRVQEGRLVHVDGQVLETPEEEDVFRALGLSWVAPEMRDPAP